MIRDSSSAKMNIPQEHKFYVIKFLHLPHPTVPHLVCVPNSWIRTRSPNDDTVCVSYPVEQHIATEGRILAGESYRPEWLLFMAKLQDGFELFDEARGFIASQQNSNSQQLQQDVEEQYVDDENDDADYEPVPMKISRKTFSFTTARNKIDLKPPVNESTRMMSGNKSSEKIISFQNVPSFTNCRPGFFRPQAGYPSKRRLSTNQPSTSAQAMADTPTFPETNKKIRIKRDLKNISRAFANIDEQFEDLTNVLNGIRTSMRDMQTVFSSLCSNLSDIVDLSDIILHTSVNSDSAPASTSTPGILRNAITRNRTEIPLVPLALRNSQDSKWTLRYRDKLPGLVELMPSTSIYLSEHGLQSALNTATDAKTLARMLLKEIFSDYALSVCSLAGGKNGVSERVRPGLDKNARAFLMEFVNQYSRDKGWPYNEHSIFMSLRNKLLEMRKSAQSGCNNL